MSYYHCPKCGKNWTHKCAHADCDAAPDEMQFMPDAVAKPTAWDWFFLTLGIVAEVFGFILLYVVDWRLFVVFFIWSAKGYLVNHHFNVINAYCKNLFK